MASINLDKPLSLSSDLLSTARVPAPKSDAPASFDNHLQRVATQPQPSGAPSENRNPSPRPSTPSSARPDGDKPKPQEPTKAAEKQKDEPPAEAANLCVSPDKPPTSAAQPANGTSAEPVMSVAARAKAARTAAIKARAAAANKARSAADSQGVAKAEKPAANAGVQPASDVKPDEGSPVDATIKAQTKPVVVDSQPQKGIGPNAATESKSKPGTNAKSQDSTTTVPGREQQIVREPTDKEPTSEVAKADPKTESKRTREPSSDTKKNAAALGDNGESAPAVEPVAANPQVRIATDLVAVSDPRPASSDQPATPAIDAPANGPVVAQDPIGTASAPVVLSSIGQNSSSDTSVGRNVSRTGGAAGPSEVDRVRFVQRVSRAMQAAGDENGSLRLRLSPPELGSVKLEVSIKDGVMSARLEAETPAAKAVLLDNFPELKNRLAEHDVSLEHFEVDLADRSSSEGSNQDPTGNAYADRGFVPPPRNKISTAGGKAEAPVAATTTRVVTSDQLNVVV